MRTSLCQYFLLQNKSLLRTAGRFILLLTTVLLVSVGFVQAQKYNYDITIRGKPVGELSVQHRAASDSVFLDVNSSISTRMIFLFTAIAAERAIFKNGKLIYSYISRKINKTKIYPQRSN